MLSKIKYSKPDFTDEFEELQRFRELQRMDKSDWINFGKTGTIVSYDNIKHNLSNVDLDYDKLEDEKKDDFERALKKGVVELPIVIKFGDDKYELLGGNTRLAGLLKNKIKPKLWVIDMNNNKINESLVTQDNKKEIFKYHNTVEPLWSKLIIDAQKFQKIYFDLENNDSVGQKKIIYIEKNLRKDQPVKYKINCELYKAGGDWEFPVLYFRIQFDSDYFILNSEYQENPEYIWDVKKPRNELYKCFVIIPPIEGGNIIRKNEKNGFSAYDNNDDNEELKGKKYTDKNYSEAWKWLVNTIEKLVNDRHKMLDETKKMKKNKLNEQNENGNVDTITLDVPLFIRMLEYAKEDAKDDMELHTATEKILELLKQNSKLSMDNYDAIVGGKKKEETNEMDASSSGSFEAPMQVIKKKDLYKPKEQDVNEDENEDNLLPQYIIDKFYERINNLIEKGGNIQTEINRIKSVNGDKIPNKIKELINLNKGKEQDVNEVTSGVDGSFDVPLFGGTKGRKNPLSIGGEKTIGARSGKIEHTKSFPKFGGPGAKFVTINPKCKKFPYCNQGDPKAISIHENKELMESIQEISKKYGIPMKDMEEIVINEIKQIFI